MTKHDFRRINVLHIDDEITYLEIIKILLQKHQYSNIKVDITINSKEVEQLLFQKNYNIIICDYRMPIMNGFEVLKHLRSIGIEIPFILLTGWEKTAKLNKKLNSFSNTRFLMKSLDCVTMTNRLVLTINSLIFKDY